MGGGKQKNPKQQNTDSWERAIKQLICRQLRGCLVAMTTVPVVFISSLPLALSVSVSRPRLYCYGDGLLLFPDVISIVT